MTRCGLFSLVPALLAACVTPAAAPPVPTAGVDPVAPAAAAPPVAENCFRGPPGIVWLRFHRDVRGLGIDEVVKIGAGLEDAADCFVRQLKEANRTVTGEEPVRGTMRMAWNTAGRKDVLFAHRRDFRDAPEAYDFLATQQESLLGCFEGPGAADVRVTVLVDSEGHAVDATVEAPGFARTASECAWKRLAALEFPVEDAGYAEYDVLWRRPAR